MNTHQIPEFTALNALAAVGIALIYITLSSLLKEPDRQKFSAIMIAGAGAAYLSGGLGVWEFPFCALMTFVAFNWFFMNAPSVFDLFSHQKTSKIR